MTISDLLFESGFNVTYLIPTDLLTSATPTQYARVTRLPFFL